MYNKISELKSILKDENYRSIEIALKILSQIEPCSFQLYTLEQARKIALEDVSVFNKTIFEEMISKCQIASIGSLRRTLSWLEAISISQSNFTSFVSSVRGLMENVGDAYFSYQHLAISLAGESLLVQGCLNGEVKNICDTPSFDNHIDHFLFATKGMDKTHKNPNLKPEQTFKYIKELEKSSNIKYYELYGDLCQFVHPSGHSLAINFEGGSKEGELIYSGKNKDEEMITLYLEHYPNLLSDLIMKAFNPVFLPLKTVGKFNSNVIKTPDLNDINLSNIKAWRDIEKKFSQ